MKSSAWLVLVALSACASPTIRGATPDVEDAVATGASRRIVLRVFDPRGQRIDWARFQQIADGGQAGNGLDDALVDPATLVVARIAPLRSSNGVGDGDPSVVLPARGAFGLSVAWPNSGGYSELIFHLPERSGTYDFDRLAAAQAIADIRASLGDRPWYRPGARVAELIAEARRDYTRGRYAMALNAGDAAEPLLLQEAGVAYAASHPAPREWGATFDTIAGGEAVLKTAAALFPKHGWLRICFDPGEKPRYYAREIARAHTLGLRVVGQILDSSEMRRWGVASFERRTREYVNALPAVDEWETGNEVNGDWLGSTASVVAKTAYASKYVKEHTHARVLVTLYWELGESRPDYAIFNWVGAEMAAIEPYVDDVGVSLYPRQNPMGEPFDRVMARLHGDFPHKHILITELDYDRGAGWWWGARGEIASRGRNAVARLYQSAILGYAFSGGGTFWWYFVEEVSPGNPLFATLRAVYRAAH